MRNLPMTAALALLLLGGAACRDHDHPAGGHDGAGPGRATIAVTDWTDRSELFMEYPELVAGETGRFAIHVTDLSGFRPLTEGESVVVLTGPGGEVHRWTGGLSRPGIYGVDVTPPGAGTFEMSLQVVSPAVEDLHRLGPVVVHRPDAVPEAPPEEEDGSITFLKEQQWTLDFATEPAAIRLLRESIIVPGTLVPRPGGEAVLASPVPGRVDPEGRAPVPGTRVAAGDLLARIAPAMEKLQDPSGLRSERIEAEQQHRLALQEKDRAARLVEARAVPERRLAEAEAALRTAEARLEAAEGRLEQLAMQSQAGDPAASGDWFHLRAPFAGTLAEVRVTPGAGVEEGEELFLLVDARRLHAVGAVPEGAATGPVHGAELLVDGEAPIPLGPPVSSSDVVDTSSRTVEVRFALDNRGLRLPAGRRVRLRLFTGDEGEHPAVPESAVVDDGGRPVVFVHSSGESFQRRPVRLGSREGGYVHLLEGVAPGERVVTRGAYLIRLASMSSQIPAHGHVH